MQVMKKQPWLQEKEMIKSFYEGLLASCLTDRQDSNAVYDWFLVSWHIKVLLERCNQAKNSFIP